MRSSGRCAGLRGWRCSGRRRRSGGRNGRAYRRSGAYASDWRPAHRLAIRALDFLAQSLLVFGGDSVGVFLEQLDDGFDAPIPALELVDYGLE
jgi:hypothetical protein